MLSKGGQLVPLKDADPKTVLQRYLSDESTKDIAESYGVTRQALNQFLIRTAEQEWKDAQVARAIARKESAEDDLDNAESTPDALALSRTRERLKAAQWDLERVCRRIYGQDAPPAGANAVQININLRGASPQYDSERTAQSPVIQGSVVDKSE